MLFLDHRKYCMINVYWCMLGVRSLQVRWKAGTLNEGASISIEADALFLRRVTPVLVADSNPVIPAKLSDE